MSRHIRTLAPALGIALLAACTSWHRSPTAAEGVARANSGEIHVNRVDGSMLRLVNASIVGDSLVGTSPVSGARVAIPVSSVVSTETKQVSAGRTAALGGGVLIGVVAVTGLLAVALLLAALGT